MWKLDFIERIMMNEWFNNIIFVMKFVLGPHVFSHVKLTYVQDIQFHYDIIVRYEECFEVLNGRKLTRISKHILPKNVIHCVQPILTGFRTKRNSRKIIQKYLRLMDKWVFPFIFENWRRKIKEEIPLFKRMNCTNIGFSLFLTKWYFYF